MSALKNQITVPFRTFEMDMERSHDENPSLVVQPMVPSKNLIDLDDANTFQANHGLVLRSRPSDRNIAPLVDVDKQNTIRTRSASLEKEESLFSPKIDSTRANEFHYTKNAASNPNKKVKDRTPRKGGKGALGWFMKPFGKEHGHDLSTPNSIISKPSQRSIASFRSVKEETASVRVRMPKATRRRHYPDTSESQQRRWLLQVHRAIRDGAVRQVIIQSMLQDQQQPAAPLPWAAPDTTHIEQTAQTEQTEHVPSSDSEIFEEPATGDHDDGLAFPHHQPRHRYNRRKKDYDAYTTFDDDLSVSSMELLFNWLTCRNNSSNNIAPVGMEFDLRSNSTDPYVPNAPKKVAKTGGCGCR